MSCALGKMVSIALAQTGWFTSCCAVCHSVTAKRQESTKNITDLAYVVQEVSQSLCKRRLQSKSVRILK